MSEYYAPPPGPPPGRDQQGQHQPPPGPPPPSWNEVYGHSYYTPPPGPPPSHEKQENPENTDEPPPYNPRLSARDNARLPQRPLFTEEVSPTANATRNDAIRGHDWCDRNPLWRAIQPDENLQRRTSQCDLRLTSPPGNRNATVQQTEKGSTHVRTTAQCTDSIFLSDIPIYTAATASPRIIYFELNVISMGVNDNADGEAGIAIGFLAPPYPAWRLPGWHRASLGIHGDDGRRYVDNSYGGREFTSAFRNGDVVGIGMRFPPPAVPGRPNDCEVFFTRNGLEEGKWRLHEERDQDQKDGNVVGLEGTHDLLAAVGCFGAVEFDVRFRPDFWRFRP